MNHPGSVLIFRYASRIYPNIDLESCITDLKILLKEFRCPCDRFDWFLGISFLIFKGDMILTRNFLKNLEQYPLFTSRIWSLFSESETNGLYVSQCHVLRGVLEENETSVTPFILSGITPSQISLKWFRECFINVLNFDDINIYLVGSILYGPSFPIYTAQQCINIMLKQEPLVFGIRSLGNSIPFKDSDSWKRIAVQMRNA